MKYRYTKGNRRQMVNYKCALEAVSGTKVKYNVVSKMNPILPV
jgi:hypothetical protein